MAVTGLNFAAQVDAWTRETEGRLLAVRNQSADDVGELLRSYTPVDFGFLAGTIQASTDQPTPIDPSKTNAEKASIPANASAGDVALVIAGASLRNTIYICFTMAYAPFVEYGTSRMAPRAMVRRAAAQWERIVTQTVERAKARASRAGR